MPEAERYWLDIVGLTLPQGMGSGTNLVDRGWIFFSSGVAAGEWHWAGVGLLVAQQLALTLKFTSVNERAVSLHLRVRESSLTVICAYALNNSEE